jgi:hypothetical protein
MRIYKKTDPHAPAVTPPNNHWLMANGRYTAHDRAWKTDENQEDRQIYIPGPAPVLKSLDALNSQ